jgi:hypothetical protein
MSHSHIPAKELADRILDRVQVLVKERTDQPLDKESMTRRMNFERAELEGCLVEIGLFLEITPMAFLEAPESIQEVLLEAGKFTDEMAALMEPSPLGA